MYKPDTNLVRLTGLLVITTLSMPLARGAEPGPLQQLDQLLEEMNTLTADVTQLIIESDGGVLEESDIRMMLKRPDGFSWETLSPFPELVVTDGKQLWNYQPDLEQVVVEDWDQSRSELAAQLLAGNTENLDQEYLVNLRETDSAEFTEFTLTPRAADNIYRQINLTFQNRNLDMIFIDSSNGQKTVWQFRNLSINSEIPDSAFVFVPPVGVEVIFNSYVD